MLAGERPPEEKTVGHWLTQKLKRGTKLAAHVAGNCVGVTVHCGKPSKPCMRRYLGAGAKCFGCDNGIRKDWLGYQPFYRELDGRPIVCTFHKDMIERLDKLTLHQRVEIGQEDADNVGLWLRAEKGMLYSTTLNARKIGADIAGWLPVLWKLRGVITREMLLSAGPEVTSDKPVSLSETDELDEIYRNAPGELRARSLPNRIMRGNPAEAIGMGDVIDGTLNGVRVNGKPKPK